MNRAVLKKAARAILARRPDDALQLRAENAAHVRGFAVGGRVTVEVRFIDCDRARGEYAVTVPVIIPAIERMIERTLERAEGPTWFRFRRPDTGTA